MKTNLTQFDEYPKGMLIYMRNYGPHFNKKLYEFATSLMYKENKEKVTPYTKEDINNILNTYGIVVDNAQLYDTAYVATMCKADFLNSSIIDEQHMALYIKDVIDDPDAPDGLVFNRWYADMSYMGVAIDWDEML